MVLVNTPHNPTGAVFTREQLTLIGELAAEYDAVVVTDEVYEHMTFRRGEHVPMATLPGLADRTLTISSAGKTFSVTGWKVGWVHGPARWSRGAGGQAVPHLRQRRPVPARHRDRAGAARRLLRATSPPAWPASATCSSTGLRRAGFTVLPAARHVLRRHRRRPAGFDDGAAFCWRLPELVGVAAVPVSVFCADPDLGRTLVRFAFCKREEVLTEAVSRLASLRSLS